LERLRYGILCVAADARSRLSNGAYAIKVERHK